MALAALGGVDILAANPKDDVAHHLLVDASRVIAPRERAPGRFWTDNRLAHTEAHAEATMAEAMIGIGTVLRDSALLEEGLALLEALMRRHDRARRDPEIPVHQHPNEMAALADACWQAWTATGDHAWGRLLLSSGAWFACAGRSPEVESDLACISARQRAARFRSLAPLREVG
jgi:hypothetical protein